MQQVDYRSARVASRPPRDTSRSRPALREARRTANRKLTTGELRCECAQAGCHAPIPVVAETYRGARDGFVVIPDHAGQDVVIAAADRFFIVEVRRLREAS